MKKYILISGLALSLSACDILDSVSPDHETCTDIALSRLKHPGSFKKISSTETAVENNQIDVILTFKAWNDYKVPIAYRISCRFQHTDNAVAPTLISIKWNGRPIRSHELDDIQQKFR